MSGAETGTARRELFGRGSVYTLATAVQAASTLLMLPIATRLLDSAAFGRVVVVTVAISLLGHVLGLGLPSAVMLERLGGDPDAEGRGRRLAGATVLVAVGLATLTSLMGGSWGSGVVLAAWGGAAMVALTVAQALLRSVRQAGRFVAATVAVSVGGPLAGVVAVAVGPATAERYLIAFVAGVVTGAVVGLILAGVRRPRRGDGAMVRAGLQVGLPLVPHALALYALLAADRFVVDSTLGPAATGRYQVAYLVGAAGLSLLAAVNNAWSPMVLGAAEDRRWPLLARTTADLEWGLTLIVALTTMTAPAALAVAAPAGYGVEGLVPVTAVVAASVLPFCWYLSAGHVLLARRRTAALGWTTPVVAAATIGLGFLVIPVGGLVAAGVLTVVSYGALAAWVRHRAGRLAAVPWSVPDQRATTVVTLVLVALGILLPTGGVAALVRVVPVVVVVMLVRSRLGVRAPTPVTAPAASTT